jgi:hypothetical protein
LRNKRQRNERQRAGEIEIYREREDEIQIYGELERQIETLGWRDSGTKG